MEARPGEDEAIGAMRGDLFGWLCRWGREDRVCQYASSAATRYLADSASVDPGVVDAVLKLAARRGDAAMFDDFRSRFATASVPSLRRRYLGVLGAFEDPVLEARALDMMLDEAVRPTEIFVVMGGFFGKDEAAGRRLYEWITAHYDKLAPRMPPPALRFMPMIGSGCSEERLRRTREFFADPSRAVPGGEQTLERVSDQVHGCISLREREGASVGEFLKTVGAK
jgi:alanyl aminopeptidase